MIDTYLVARDYVPTRRDELLLLPPDVREWLPKGHLVWFLLDLIERMDTSVLHRRSKLGGAGRAPYDPEMLFGVLVYGYACGLRSSRKIEKRCQEDTAFMVLSGLCYPDHVTIARFRADHAGVMDELFDRVLVLCAKAGLGRLEHVAIDGTKIAANAAAARTRDVDGLRGTGRRWLNEKFYQQAFAAMPDAMEVVAAFRGSELVAGAFNVASATRLYGRYWGCFEEHPFLHFNVCYYHSIADCIARGLEVFEGGAGGEHKLARGFLPSLTWSAHGFSDAQLDRAVREHLARETPARAASIERSLRESPIFKAAS